MKTNAVILGFWVLMATTSMANAQTGIYADHLLSTSAVYRLIDNTSDQSNTADNDWQQPVSTDGGQNSGAMSQPQPSDQNTTDSTNNSGSPDANNNNMDDNGEND